MRKVQLSTVVLLIGGITLLSGIAHVVIEKRKPATVAPAGSAQLRQALTEDAKNPGGEYEYFSDTAPVPVGAQ